MEIVYKIIWYLILFFLLLAAVAKGQEIGQAKKAEGLDNPGPHQPWLLWEISILLFANKIILGSEGFGSVVGYWVFGFVFAFIIERLIWTITPSYVTDKWVIETWETMKKTAHLKGVEAEEQKKKDLIEAKKIAHNQFDLRTELSHFLTAIRAKWGSGNEFFAGNAFNMISENYLEWFIEEAKMKNMNCRSDRESATLELLEALREQGLLTRRVNDQGWYYTLR
ncbi:MAG: hypothetical protein WCP85_15300 [Mariniphaga sp.]